MMYFLDFDRTLFDTDAFKEYLKAHPGAAELSGEPREDLGRALNDRVRTGELSFAPGELARFVYQDVPEFLRMLGNEAMILTYGNPELQRIKIASALAGIPRVQALYSGEMRKGEFMKDRIAGYGVAALFVDDTPLELELMTAAAPGVRCFEMRRDGAPGDGRWPVVRSLTELP